MYDRDFDYDYFGFKVGSIALAELCSQAAFADLTARRPPRARHRPAGALSLPAPRLPARPPAQTLERSYMLRVNGRVVERPQHMLMRVAVGIHLEDVDAGALGAGVACVLPAACLFHTRAPRAAADMPLPAAPLCSSQRWRPTTFCRSAGSPTPRLRCSMPARRARSCHPASWSA